MLNRKKILKGAKEGNKIDFGEDCASGDIPAELVREAILIADETKECSPHKSSKFLIRNANIQGDLDLSHLHPTRQSFLISLVFENCKFSGELDLSHSTLTHLEISNSRLSTLKAVGAHIVGFVTLDSIWSSEDSPHESGIKASLNWHEGRGPSCVDFRKSLERDLSDNSSIREPVSQGLCHIVLKEAEFKSLRIKSSVLVGPKAKKNIDRSNEILSYGLELAASVVHGSIHLIDDTAVLGGIGASGCKVHGDFYMAGAKLVGGGGVSFSGQLMKVDGFIGMRSKMNADGSIFTVLIYRSSLISQC